MGIETRASFGVVIVAVTVLLFSAETSVLPQWMEKGGIEVKSGENDPIAPNSSYYLKENDIVRVISETPALIAEPAMYAIMLEPKTEVKLVPGAEKKSKSVSFELKTGAMWINSKTPIVIAVEPAEIVLESGIVFIRRQGEKIDAVLFQGLAWATDPMLGTEVEMIPGGAGNEWSGGEWIVSEAADSPQALLISDIEDELVIPDVPDIEPGPAARILLSVDRPRVMADPTQTVFVSALVLDQSSRIVADDMIVYFVSDKGEVTSSAPTVNGIATAAFAPQDEPGMATIDALSGESVHAVVEIEVFPSDQIAPDVNDPGAAIVQPGPAELAPEDPVPDEQAPENPVPDDSGEGNE